MVKAMSRRLVNSRTLQGIKNLKRIPYWRFTHGDKKCRIYSKQWEAYWKANASGYTTDINEAGIYTLASALDNSSHCGPEKKIEYRFIDKVYTP